jgi:hypothetical protein
VTTPIARAARCSTGSGIPWNAAACSASPSAAAICSVATPRSLAKASAAIARVSAAPSSALDGRSRTKGDLPGPAGISPMLNVLVNGVSSRVTSRTTAPPPGAPPRLMHSNATYRGRAYILKRYRLEYRPSRRKFGPFSPGSAPRRRLGLQVVPRGERAPPCPLGYLPVRLRWLAIRHLSSIRGNQQAIEVAVTS